MQHDVRNIAARVMVTLAVMMTLGSCAAPATRTDKPNSAKAPTPNVLWIMLDDCRADALSCYGQPWARTPNMDRIAQRGVRFDTAIVQNIVCSPSRQSIYTGHYCHDLHHMAMWWKDPELPARYFSDKPVPPEDRIQLRETLAELGMTPWAIGKVHGKQWELIDIGKDPKSPGPGEGPGHYDEVHLPDHGWHIGGTTTLTPEEMPAAVKTDAALKKLRELTASGKPWFLRISYKAPHVPIFVPPQYMIDPASVDLPYPTPGELALKPRFEREQLSRYSGTLDLTHNQLQVARGSYYGMVWHVDDQVGRVIKLLEDAGQLDDTLIVINSDHGLQMGEHGLHKKRTFYEQTVKVPLIFSYPRRLPRGRVISEQVELIDMMPTVLELLGKPKPAAVPGHSLLPLIDGRVTEWRPAVFSEHDYRKSFYEELRHDSGRRVMIRTKRWKLIYFRDERAPGPDGALYDLQHDPGETRNLYNDPAHRDVIKRLEGLVDAWARGERWSPPKH